jgi:type IV secretory pathway TraG/TraD family ATPase VirD4
VEVGGHAVALPVADARHHVHLLGATGSGKSTLMTHLILDDIRNHRGVVVIDPKGDLVLDVLDRLPASITERPERRNRLVVIDPDQPGGATFNPLQVTPGTDADLVVDNVVAIFSRIFQRHWGAADRRRLAGGVPDVDAAHDRRPDQGPAAAERQAVPGQVHRRP